jgi:hypothetical protein
MGDQTTKKFSVLALINLDLFNSTFIQIITDVSVLVHIKLQGKREHFIHFFVIPINSYRKQLTCVKTRFTSSSGNICSI